MGTTATRRLVLTLAMGMGHVSMGIATVFLVIWERIVLCLPAPMHAQEMVSAMWMSMCASATEGSTARIAPRESALMTVLDAVSASQTAPACVQLGTAVITVLAPLAL